MHKRSLLQDVTGRFIHGTRLHISILSTFRHPGYGQSSIHAGDYLAPLLIHNQNVHNRRIVSVSTIRITMRISNYVHFRVRILQPLLRLSSELKGNQYHPGCAYIAVVSRLKKLVGIGSPIE